ncbi:glycine dehydrogenase (aminomethyl-transferring) [Cephaloticoccus primus]|uniref:Glycine dehydrogenase (decarboxylating) n=1 Tax=Cephaloticoccus primus TaxID=1548207 RepID=A0A139SKL7_9BACT|nr:aminomethyl-transferring glycine dehydrogenase [Cephaloticoccus primus]KXU35060.1 glycine dehydrogenase (aminomethyl-transferring) [Cephaloticoccus primus]
MPAPRDLLDPIDKFEPRHSGVADSADLASCLQQVGYGSLDALSAAALPADIGLREPLALPEAAGESAALAELRALAEQNQVFRSFIGAGYHDCATPAVIQRNILENPGWYTAYTPYQSEISQGRLEALLNFQTLITDLTALDIANASMLDEGTAAAEAMMMCHRIKLGTSTGSARFFVSGHCHPQTIDVVRTRAEPLGIEVVVGDHRSFDFASAAAGVGEGQPATVGVLVQYPDTRGSICDYEDFFARAHAAGALCVVAADLLALTLLRAPGEFGADIAVGTAQRFGVPMGFGGPHAGYLATRDAHKRQMPGRLVGLSKDAQGQPALRLALGTREQHIRREKATSNICTAQVLLAVMASMYAVYHGPQGLRRIAQRTRLLTQLLARGLQALGAEINAEPVFDTLTVGKVAAARVHAAAAARRMNLRHIDEYTVGISLDELTTVEEVETLLSFFGETALPAAESVALDYEAPHARRSRFLAHAVFNRYHTEHEMLRYIKRLEAKDLSLCHSMISLGSCTMKLNATSQMLPITWPQFARLHPFAPAEQWRGYRALFNDLEKWLAEITGFAAVSLQPNAGSQGEYAGLLALRAYHQSRGDTQRQVCLIPTSAHGTNPASAVMCGMRVVPVACDEQGNVNLDDLRAKAAAHAAELAALMITYPSTHGVFEPGIREICEIVHAHGGQVYMDGANMNAQVGLSSPGFIGADVCHLNLHKTFCVPHGGGGPGVGPIGVAAHLAPFLPSETRRVEGGGEFAGGPQSRNGGAAVSAAPFGSASILPISWMYIRMMGADGLRRATQLAILNANYIAKRLEPYFPVLYRGPSGLVAHECILELRDWKPRGIDVEDVAKRLIDYGYHAPTMSFPVPGTLMIEPTESETQAELDRFCDALIAIHGEMTAIASGEADGGTADNLLKNAPHTAAAVTASEWLHPYTREAAAYPDAHTRAAKFWPTVGRVDNVYGDRNLVCACSS